jgi:tetratricopeptide (TPR) repeat protein
LEIPEMNRTTRFWKGVGPLALGGLLFCAGAVNGDDTDLAKQLSAAGRQALAQGRPDEARSLLRNALRLDPNNNDARVALEKAGPVRLASYQDPVVTPPVPQVPAGATLAEQTRIANVRRQEFDHAVRARLQRARDLTNSGHPEAALSELRTTLNAVQSADQVPDLDKSILERQVRSAIGATEAVEERVALERAEQYRLQAADDARLRALSAVERNQETVGVLMSEFDNLMAQGTFIVLSNSGTGNIDSTTAPYTDARARAVAARAIDPLALAPYAAIFNAQTVRFLSQSLAYVELSRYRTLLTLQDVDRAAVPFPDTKTIEYPAAADWIAMTERRRRRYGEGTEQSLLNRDDRTKAILTQLGERLTMSFPQETPLEDVLKYIKSNTQSEELDLPSGIPIYVDPIGLQEAEKTLASPVTLDLEGIPLKTSLRLILKQLDLTYTVKDGLMTITSEKADDQPTEIRVYPVADLAIIPLSLMGGGGGGMGGGMGGGGMGGMGGGGMGGMGGGGMGGGMGGGGMGGGMGGMGMMSIPPQDPSNPNDPAGAFEQKKRN